MQTGLFKTARFHAAGDRGLLVEYGDGIDPVVNNKVRSMAIVIEKNSPPGVREVIPTYRSLLIVYDPSDISPGQLKDTLDSLEKNLEDIRIPPPATVEIPVCYGGEFGPDIEFVARSHQLSIEEVIRIHAGSEYLIYMVGFTPGFPFLGGLPDVLHTPRLETPRTFVPRGSVGIANGQTGVYPVASPGGWQLIGRTPLTLFAPQRKNPFLYQAGDKIKFNPISRDAFDRLAGEET
jgi:KipI family sensor histidine kinase inhibitor